MSAPGFPHPRRLQLAADLSELGEVDDPDGIEALLDQRDEACRIASEALGECQRLESLIAGIAQAFRGMPDKEIRADRRAQFVVGVLTGLGLSEPRVNAAQVDLPWSRP